MAENAMAGVPSSLPLSTTFLSTPHSSTVEADGRQESCWFGYRLVPLYPFAPLQLQLQISQEAQELASAQMMVRAWRAKNRSPLCGEETWPMHINIPCSDGDQVVRQPRQPGLLMLADPRLEVLRADIQQVFAKNQ